MTSESWIWQNYVEKQICAVVRKGWGNKYQQAIVVLKMSDKYTSPFLTWYFVQTAGQGEFLLGLQHFHLDKWILQLIAWLYFLTQPLSV